MESRLGVQQQSCGCSLPLGIHVVAFVQLVFDHFVAADFQRRTADEHPRQRHPEDGEQKVKGRRSKVGHRESERV